MAPKIDVAETLVEEPTVHEIVAKEAPKKHGNRDGCRRKMDNPKRSRQVKSSWKSSGTKDSLKSWAKDHGTPEAGTWLRDKKAAKNAVQKTTKKRWHKQK